MMIPTERRSGRPRSQPSARLPLPRVRCYQTTCQSTIGTCVPFARVRTPLPLASVVNVATGASAGVVIVPLTVTAPLAAVELDTTSLLPLTSVPVIDTDARSPSASNDTLPVSADVPSCVPPDTVNGGALESVSAPSAPLKAAPLRVPVNVVLPEESFAIVAFTVL